MMTIFSVEEDKKDILEEQLTLAGIDFNYLDTLIFGAEYSSTREMDDIWAVGRDNNIYITQWVTVHDNKRVI
jgi:hypothetical protein